MFIRCRWVVSDFMYGAAVVKRYKCDCLRDMLEQFFKDDSSNILASAALLEAKDDDILLSIGTMPRSMEKRWKEEKELRSRETRS